MVPVIGEFVVFVALKAPIFPVPEATNPIEVLLLVQLNEVPLTPNALEN